VDRTTIPPVLDEDTYRRSRRAFLATGDMDAALLRLLTRAVARLVRFGGLPPLYSPTGQWDHEAERDVLGDWFAARLAGGQLRAMLSEAATPQAFVAIGEKFLRNHLINRLQRTQAGNLYRRIRRLLEAGDYDKLYPASRPQDTAWGPRGADWPPWTGNDDELAAHAWGLGEFHIAPFRDDAKKRSHLLEAPELRRFVDGLLDATGCALTPNDALRALKRRFRLEEAADVSSLEEQEVEIASPVSVVDEAVAAIVARAALTELTRRQVDVLHATLARQTVREIADDLRISVGTVASEQKEITEVVNRLSDPDGDSQTHLLNALRDRLFIHYTP